VDGTLTVFAGMELASVHENHRCFIVRGGRWMNDMVSRWRGVVASTCAALALFATSSSGAQSMSDAQKNAIRESCRSDYMKHCSSVPPGTAQSLACLQSNAGQLSAGCQRALGSASGGTAAATTAATATTAKAPERAAAPQVVPQGAPSWPATVTNERGSAVVYQPQVISWPDQRTLNTRMALALTPLATKKQTMGTIEVAFRTNSDLATRTVTLSSPALKQVRFPGADPQQAQRFEEAIKTVLDAMGERRVPLDMILLSLNRSTQTPPDAGLKNDPPKIFYSSRPASLLVFDGEPVLAPVGNSTLQVAVNTNWDVFVDPATKRWYWLNNGAWLSAVDFKRAWSPVTQLPPAFSSLPADQNFAAVRKQIPGRRLSPGAMPTIFVSTVPAVIVVTTGTPKLVPIAGTSLRYVSNTDVNLFVDSTTGKYYFLTSGRWFAATNLDGPWTFATNDLPADFRRIPPTSPRGSVLVSVPGTPQAQEAVLQSMIPTEGTLERSTAKIEVVYSGGPPRFEPIVGTSMTYAVNTMYDVIRVDERYYVCYQGAWFVSASPTGAWILAESVPTVIYTIPPSSPLYRVTYVRVYETTPTTVTFGYTSGYTMGYVSAGVVVYGTGYYYPPYIWPAPIPIYYPYPYTFSGTTWYNPSTGAWARGGTVYGPYGGAVSGGTAYNPNTGAWAHGGAVYGPNGGAGAWSAYNPSTGGYAHGSASWGTNSGTANANWYNARSGITGSTNQNYNQYGSWGSSTFSGADKTVTTQHQTNAQGSAGSFKSSTGAEGAGVKGAGGNSAGVAKSASGNVYADANGNVYRHTSDGWSKWNDGSWNPVTPPDRNSQQNLSGETRQQNLSGETRQQNLSGETRQQNLSGQTQNVSGQNRMASQNLSGETRAGGGFEGRSSGQNLSGETERGGNFRERFGGGGFQQGRESSGFEQLENDRFARTMGDQRFERSGGGRIGGGGRFRR
jgi:hypothetical protein